MQVATLDGRFVRSLGSVGSGLGEFVRPRGVVCAPGGLLLVSDQENLRVQVPRPRLIASFVLLCLCSDTVRGGKSPRPGATPPPCLF